MEWPKSKTFSSIILTMMFCNYCVAGGYAIEDRIHDSSVAFGTRDIAHAWLAEPTERYIHGVLGDGVEAGALVVQTTSGDRIIHRLSPRYVFEDLSPFMADLNFDGRDEIIVVRSDMQLGSALVIYGIVDGALVARAETAPIGKPFRWLNPIGAGDLDGDGLMDIALIETPHIGGVLKVLSWDAGKLILRDTFAGVTNHVLGSTALNLHALVDWDGDGLEDIVTPSQGRESLVVVAFKNGKLAEIARVALPGKVTGDIEASAEILLVPTSRGRTEILVRR